MCCCDKRHVPAEETSCEVEAIWMGGRRGWLRGRVVTSQEDVYVGRYVCM